MIHGRWWPEIGFELQNPTGGCTWIHEKGGARAEREIELEASQDRDERNEPASPASTPSLLRSLCEIVRSARTFATEGTAGSAPRILRC